MSAVILKCYCDFDNVRYYYLYKYRHDGTIREVAYGWSFEPIGTVATRLFEQRRTSYVYSIEALMLATHHLYAAYAEHLRHVAHSY